MRIDMAIGSRYMHGVSVVNWPLHRIVLSAFANRYIRAVTGLRATDCTSGYRVWRREALARLPLDTARASGYAFLTEMLYEAARRGLPDRRSRRSSSSSGRKAIEGLANGAARVAADAVAAHPPRRPRASTAPD